jgi:hypothetical protein
MKTTRFALLVITALVGAGWIFILQDIVLYNILGGFLSGPGMALTPFKLMATGPAFQMLWISAIFSVIAWIYSTYTKSPVNSAEVREMKPVWWSCMVILAVLGVGYLLIFTTFWWSRNGIPPVDGSNLNYFPVPPMAWLILLILMSFDLVLLFWLPTVIATPKSFRYVVPGALTLAGGR